MARIDLMGMYWKGTNISFLSFMVIFNFHDYGRKSTQEKAVLFQAEAMMQSWIEVLFFLRPFLLSGYPETRRLVLVSDATFTMKSQMVKSFIFCMKQHEPKQTLSHNTWVKPDGFQPPTPPLIPWWVRGFSSLLPRPVSSHGGGTLWDLKLMRIAAMSRKDSIG